MRSPKNRPATHIPTTGKYIYFCGLDKVFYACFDGLKIDLHGYERIGDAREALNEFVYELLRRERVATADNAAAYADALMA